MVGGVTAPSSRLAAARRRLRVAKYAIVAVTAAGFAAGIAATRASHPATSGHTTAASRPADTESESDEFFYGGSSIAPAASAPSIQSGGS
jgi:hypothetical protein